MALLPSRSVDAAWILEWISDMREAPERDEGG